MPRPSQLLAAAYVAATFVLSGAAHARGPYVVLRDDGTLSGKVSNPDLVLKKVMAQYDATKAPRPDVLSVWTTFPMDGNTIETLFDPAANDVTGIGLENEYGGDGTFKSSYPPLRSMLLHNDVTALAA